MEDLMNFMVTYVVPEVGVPEKFMCQAEDEDHAKEQCVNAYEDQSVVVMGVVGGVNL